MRVTASWNWEVKKRRIPKTNFLRLAICLFRVSAGHSFSAFLTKLLPFCLLFLVDKFQQWIRKIFQEEKRKLLIGRLNLRKYTRLRRKEGGWLDHGSLWSLSRNACGFSRNFQKSSILHGSGEASNPTEASISQLWNSKLQKLMSLLAHQGSSIKEIKLFSSRSSAIQSGWNFWCISRTE